MQDVDQKWDELEASGWSGVAMADAFSSKLILQSLDKFGATILHRAAKSRACQSEVFHKLIDILPREHAETQSFDGNTALHFAAAQGNIASVLCLLERFPAAAEIQNSKGCTPLHSALLSLQSRTSARLYVFEIVHAMLQACPRAAAMRESRGNLLPLHIAVAEGHASEVAALLLAVCPSAAACSDRGRSHIRGGGAPQPSKIFESSSTGDSSKIGKSSGTLVEAAAAAAVAAAGGTAAGGTVQTTTAATDELVSHDVLHFRRSAQLARQRLAQHSEERKREERRAKEGEEQGLGLSGDAVHNRSAGGPESVGQEILRMISRAENESDAAADETEQPEAGREKEREKAHFHSNAAAPTPSPAASMRPSAAVLGMQARDTSNFEVIDEIAVVRPHGTGSQGSGTGTGTPRLTPRGGALNIFTRFLSHSSLRPDLPLHLALTCKSPPNWETVSALLDVLPEAAGVPDSSRKLPLFAAIRRRAPANVLKALLSAYPGALFVREEQVSDTLSVNEAIANNARAWSQPAGQRKAAAAEKKEGLSALQLAMQTYSQARTSSAAPLLLSGDLRVRDVEREREAEEDCDSIITIIRAFPLGAFDKQATTHTLPFDYALGRGMWPVCTFLTEYCLQRQEPVGKKQKRKGKALPSPDTPLSASAFILHATGVDKGIGIDNLAASMSDKDPLVDALKANAPIDLLRLLLEAYPEAAAYERDNAQWPLHFACTACTDAEAVRLVLDAFPPAAACCDYFSKFPLHYLCEGRADPRISPLNKPRGSNSAEDDTSALQRLRSLSAVTLHLAYAHMPALSAADNKGKIPFDIALAFRCDASVVDSLLVANPSPTSRVGHSGKTVFWAVVDPPKASGEVNVGIGAGTGTHQEGRCGLGGALSDPSGRGFDLAFVLLKHSLPVLCGHGDVGTPNPLYAGVWHDVCREPSGRFLLLVERVLDAVGLVHLLATAVHTKGGAKTAAINMSINMSTNMAINVSSNAHARTTVVGLTAETAAGGAFSSVGRSVLEISSAEVRQMLLHRMYFLGRFQLPPERNPASVAPAPAHLTKGGTYYQAQGLKSNGPPSPIRLGPPRPTASHSQPLSPAAAADSKHTLAIEESTAPDAKPESESESEADNFVCGLLAKDRLPCNGRSYGHSYGKEGKAAQSTAVGILFCSGATAKHAIHRAELSRERASRPAASREVARQFAASRNSSSNNNKLEAEAEVEVEAASASSPSPSPASRTQADAPGEQAVGSIPAVDAGASGGKDATGTPARGGAGAVAGAGDSTVGVGVGADSGTNAAGWWDKYLHMAETETLQWFDCDLIRPLQLREETTTLTLAADGSLLVNRLPPRAMTPTPTPTRPVPTAAHKADGPQLGDLGAPGRFIGGTYQTLAPHHRFPLVCTHPIDPQREYVQQQLERALGASDAALPTFCAVFEGVDSHEDLQSLMLWLQKTIELCLAPPEAVAAATFTSHVESTEGKCSVAAAAADKEEEEEEKEEEESPPPLDCDDILDRAIGRIAEIETNVLLLKAATAAYYELRAEEISTAVVEEEEEREDTAGPEGVENVLDVPAPPSVEVAAAAAAAMEPLAREEDSDPAQKNNHPRVPSAPVSPRSSASVSSSRSSRKREAVKPPIKLTHRNDGGGVVLPLRKTEKND